MTPLTLGENLYFKMLRQGVLDLLDLRLQLLLFVGFLLVEFLFLEFLLLQQLQSFS